MRKKIFQQQGDVLMASCASVPRDANRTVNNHLAEGEATGHYHEAVGEGVAVLDCPDGRRFLSAPKGARVTHQEHHEQALPAGNYEIRRVQEYDHFAEESRAVAD